MSDYTMPIRGIKKIMLKEMKEKGADIVSKSEWHKDLLFALFGNAEAELESCESYGSLDWFCHKYYRMSLYDWVQSL